VLRFAITSDSEPPNFEPDRNPVLPVYKVVTRLSRVTTKNENREPFSL